MVETIKKSDCTGCKMCGDICPVNAISFENQKAKIDPEKCIECGKCMKVCPYNAITESQRPCIRGCKAKAISLNDQKKAVIDMGFRLADIYKKYVKA
jgi:ferredoxin